MSKAQDRTKRQILLDQLRVAGYHGDSAEATRLWVACAGVVGIEARRAAMKLGEIMRDNGMRCNCAECKAKAGKP